jgi:hypothetical protein
VTEDCTVFTVLMDEVYYERTVRLYVNSQPTFRVKFVDEVNVKVKHPVSNIVLYGPKMNASSEA